MIRRGHAAGETIRQLARKHNVHRRVVRQPLESANPICQISTLPAEQSRVCGIAGNITSAIVLHSCAPLCRAVVLCSCAA